MRDLKRIHYVTQNYTNLQGLRWIIWGLLCLAIAAEDGGWLPTALTIIVVVPVGIALLLWSGSYYAHNYGRVEGPEKAHVEPLRIAIIAITALTSFLVDRIFHPPLSIALLVLAAGLAIMYRQLGQSVRWYYLALALLVAAADFALLWLPIPSGSSFLRPGVVLWTAVGLSLIISGFFDHLLLSRTMRPVE